MCIECCGDQQSMVATCPSKPGTSFECGYWPVRLGKDPDPPSEARRKQGLINAAKNFGKVKDTSLVVD